MRHVFPARFCSRFGTFIHIRRHHSILLQYRMWSVSALMLIISPAWRPTGSSGHYSRSCGIWLLMAYVEFLDL